jgi:alpha-1,2-glucosyltransferase
MLNALRLVPLLTVLVALAVGFWTISHLDVGIGDEDVHRFQINWFIEGRYEIFQYVTMVPLYH